jgi:hypothetical protein
MSDPGQFPPTGDPEGRPPTEDELRAAYEEHLRQIRAEELIVQTILSLLNIGALRAGRVPGQEDERDPEQLRLAIEGVRALLPLVADLLGPDAAKLRDALSGLQMAYAQAPPAEAPPSGSDEPGGQAPPEPEPEVKPGEAGPAQRSGRLWVPGQ